MVTVAGAPFHLVIDTGFTYVRGSDCVSLEEPAYQAVREHLRGLQHVRVQDIGGRVDFVESGVGEVALPGVRATAVHVRVVNAGANLLGVCYFHRLPGLTLRWDFGARTMTITPRPDAGP